MSVNHVGPSSSKSGGGGSNPGCGGPCGACKFLRRKCVPGCVFTPHFDSEQGSAHFAAVHKVFGASNVSKLLSSIPFHKRQDAILTVCYEAQARVCDPVHGCVAHILELQQQVMSLQAELSCLQVHATTISKQPIRPPQPTSAHPPDQIMSTVPKTDIPSVIYMHQHQPHDLPPLFDPKSQQSSWAAVMQHVIDPHQSVGLPSAISDLEVLACELIREQSNYMLGHTSSSPTVSKME